MKKIILILLLCISFPAFARGDEVGKNYSDVPKSTMEDWGYGPQGVPSPETNLAVSQEKLDMYRQAHPNFKFPKKIDELTEEQARQILQYFYSEYRFGSIKHAPVWRLVLDIFINMKLEDAEKTVNQAINEYYDFPKMHPGSPLFSAPFGSEATVEWLNISEKNMPLFFSVLREVRRKKQK